MEDSGRIGIPALSEAIGVGREDAAKLLDISVRMLDELVRDKKIPSRKIGRRRIFSVDALRAWLRGDQ